MTTQYDALIERFCAQVRLQFPGQIANGAAFEVDRVLFALRYDSDADAVRMYADLGSIPAPLRKHFYYTLLSENFTNTAGASASFCVSGRTHNAVLIEQTTIESMSSIDLENALAALSHRAKAWRAQYDARNNLP